MRTDNPLYKDIEERIRIMTQSVLNLIDIHKEEIDKLESQIQSNNNIDVHTKNILKLRLADLESYRNETTRYAFVIMWHTIENIMNHIVFEYAKEINKYLNKNINNKNILGFVQIEKTRWEFKEINKFYDQFSDKKLKELPEYDTCSLIRFICNCCKHNDSITTQEIVDKHKSLVVFINLNFNFNAFILLKIKLINM